MSPIRSTETANLRLKYKMDGKIKCLLEGFGNESGWNLAPLGRPCKGWEDQVVMCTHFVQRNHFKRYLSINACITYLCKCSV